jgi:5'-nucleotidase
MYLVLRMGGFNLKLLITNDDGVNAMGIFALARELEKYHDIIIAAPDDQRSASSHSITLTRPLKVREVKLEGLKCKAYSIDGTPADCVRIGIDKLIEDKVDMVVSGINRGLNIGADVLYSGTVSAAVEAAIYKIPSVAVSTEVTDELSDYEIAARYAVDIIKKAWKNNIENDLVLNVNVPRIQQKGIKGIKICKIGSVVYNNYFEELKTHGDHRIFDIKGKKNENHFEDTDAKFINEGYVTLTPLHYDLTNFRIMREVEQWF